MSCLCQVLNFTLQPFWGEGDFYQSAVHNKVVQIVLGNVYNVPLPHTEVAEEVLLNHSTENAVPCCTTEAELKKFQQTEVQFRKLGACEKQGL